MIRDFRLRMKLTQKNMAWVLKVKRGTYSSWESRYKTHVPSWLYKKYKRNILRLIFARIMRWVKN